SRQFPQLERPPTSFQQPVSIPSASHCRTHVHHPGVHRFEFRQLALPSRDQRRLQPNHHCGFPSHQSLPVLSSLDCAVSQCSPKLRACAASHFAASPAPDLILSSFALSFASTPIEFFSTDQLSKSNLRR